MGNFIGLRSTNNEKEDNKGNETPVRKMKLNDPRSPSSSISRTPVVIKNDPLKVINDPRSPNTHVNRTPIGISYQNYTFSKIRYINSAVKDEALRSQETFTGKTGGDILRRQVSLHTLINKNSTSFSGFRKKSF